MASPRVACSLPRGARQPETTRVATIFSRRSLMAAATAVGSTIIVKPTRAADHTFAQYHNQPASGTLHKNLSAMWDAIGSETNGRVEAIVHADPGRRPRGIQEAPRW
jgi:hypothetical protein